MGIGGEVVARLTAVIGVDSKELKAGLAEAEAATKQHSTKMGKALNAAGKVSAVGFAALAGAAYEGVKGAVALQAKMTVLNKTLKNAHVSASDAADASKYLEDQSNKTGFAIGDLADGFGKSVTALGSYKKAQRETALAENIARSTGESLTMANKQATKVFEGKSTALAKLGVTLGKVTTAEDVTSARLKVHNAVVEKSWKQYHLSAAAMANAKASLAQYDKNQMASAKATDQRKTATLDAQQATAKYKGSTEAYGKTLAGQLELTENRVKNLLDTLGAKLLPVITSIFGFLAQHTNVLIGIGAALGAIWVASVAWTAAMKVQTLWTKIVAAGTAEAEGAQWSLNTALMANPVALVVIAIVALVAVIVLAYKHVKVFRDAVNGAWGVIKHAFSSMKDAAESVFHRISSLASGIVDWLKQHWPLLLGILLGPFGLLVGEIVQHWDAIKRDAGNVVDWFKKLPGKIGNALSGIGGAIGGAFSGVWSSVQSGFKTGINTVIIDPLNSLINDAVHLESLVPGSPNLHIPHDPIPRLARGGIVPGTGNRDSVLAMLTPGELVLNRKQQGRLASMLGVGGTGGEGGGGVTINQTIITATDDQGVHMRAARFAAQAAFG